MLKKITSFLFTALLFMSVIDVAKAEDFSSQFDEYGISVNRPITILAEAKQVSEWNTMPSKENVPLNKSWTITFNDDVEMSKIEAIVIERNNSFIPVFITKTAQKQVQVSSKDSLVGNANYSLKVFLSNGLKYQMDFKTTDSTRDADKEPNSSYPLASNLYLNEVVSGALGPADREDFYKITIPSDGTLNIAITNLAGNSFNASLYREKGDDDYSIISDYAKTINFNAGLQPGTYYLKISSHTAAMYNIETEFIENLDKNDTASGNYVTAGELLLNAVTTGHINYIGPVISKNAEDYYKIVIPTDGLLTVRTTMLAGGKLNTCLYGASGSDAYSIQSIGSSTISDIKIYLAAGTYYLRINSSNHYGSYKIENIFTPSSTKNDEASSVYITAPLLMFDTVKTGHLGYTYENTGVNIDDYYKISVPNDGTLSIEAASLTGNQFSVYLYGEKGNDDYPSKLSTGISKTSLDVNVKAGTYYLRFTSRSPLDYEFKVTKNK